MRPLDQRTLIQLEKQCTIIFNDTLEKENHARKNLPEDQRVMLLISVDVWTDIFAHLQAFLQCMKKIMCTDIEITVGK